DDDVIENRFVSNAIQQAQTRIEGYNFDARKYILEYDDVMNKQRETVYGLRRQILFSESSKELIENYLQDYIERVVSFHTASYEWDSKELVASFEAVVGAHAEIATKVAEFAENRD